MRATDPLPWVRFGKKLGSFERDPAGSRFNGIARDAARLRLHGFDGAGHVVGLSPAGERNDHDVFAKRCFAKASRRVIAVEIGHIDIHHDNVRPKFLCDPDGFQAIAGGADIVPLQFEQQAECVAGIMVIVDNEDSGF